MREALEKLAIPASVPEGWKPITDVQWMNIVNLNHAWENYEKEDAINEVVKLVEARCKANNPTGVSALACLQSMCEESLAPDIYEMWLQVKAALIATRKSLTAAPPLPVSDERKDAERYRWLRDESNQVREDSPCVSDDSFNAFFGDELDEKIDSEITAMQEDKP